MPVGGYCCVISHLDRAGLLPISKWIMKMFLKRLWCSHHAKSTCYKLKTSLLKTVSNILLSVHIRHGIWVFCTLYVSFGIQSKQLEFVFVTCSIWAQSSFIFQTANAGKQLLACFQRKLYRIFWQVQQKLWSEYVFLQFTVISVNFLTTRTTDNFCSVLGSLQKYTPNMKYLNAEWLLKATAYLTDFLNGLD